MPLRLLPQRWSQRLRTTRRTIRRWHRTWRTRRHRTPEQPSVRTVYNPLVRLDVDHSLGPPPDGVSWPVRVVLRDDEGVRAVYRVFGYDLAHADPDDQEQWTQTYEAFVNACRGWRVAWHTRLSRNRMESHFASVEAWMAQGELSPEATALVGERVAWQRERLGTQFLGTYECWLVVPASEGDEATLVERCDEVESWLARLSLTHYRLDFLEQTRVLAESYNVPTPPPAVIARFLADRLDPVALAQEGPALYHAIIHEPGQAAAAGLPRSTPPAPPSTAQGGRA